MFTLNSAEIDSFRHMFQNADKTPFLMLRDSQWVNTTSIRPLNKPLVDLYPTVSSGMPVTIKAINGNKILAVDCYSASGTRIQSVRPSSKTTVLEIQLDGSNGYYFLRIRTEQGDTVRKVLLNR
ncbi:MAG TPA: T9SS type A sorting domain-containing protein, partial [Bacteroidia bacterium]|nr:T9SS type A sorting domain-containing protein [Bacteroidia bacterium]